MEKTILVCDWCECDWCEEPAVATAKIQFNGSASLALDVCQPHRDEIETAAHTPKRGRPKASLTK